MSNYIDRILELLRTNPNVETFVLKQNPKDSKDRELLRLNIENKTARTIRETVLTAIDNFTKHQDEVIENEQSYEKYNESQHVIYYADSLSEEIKSLNMFNILDNPPEELTSPDAIEGLIKGYFFRISFTNCNIWAFQKVANNCITNSKKMTFHGSTLKEIKGRLYQFSNNVEFLLFDDMLLFKNDNTLASHFGFDVLIKRRAEETLKKISDSGLLSDMEKVLEHYSKNEKTYGKKLMIARNSRVIHISRNELKAVVSQSRSYSRIIKFNQNDEIEIKNKKDVDNLFKLLNDQILVSEITSIVYDTASKNEILSEKTIDSK